MNVNVQLFAAARQLAGSDALRVELGPGATVADLRAALAEQCPALGGILPHARFAVDEEYADESSPLPEGARVACIPPVSGG